MPVHERAFFPFTATTRAARRSQGAAPSEPSFSSTLTASPPRMRSRTVMRRPGTISTTS